MAEYVLISCHSLDLSTSLLPSCWKEREAAIALQVDPLLRLASFGVSVPHRGGRATLTFQS